ncbi:MAG TPA: GAF domain-containing protein, partial [Allocoleopsis sp.]
MTWVLQLQRQEQDETEPIYPDSNLLSSVLQASQAAVLVIDRQGSIVFASACIEHILGFPRAELVHQTFSASTWQITDFAGHPIPDDRFLVNQVWQTGQPSLGKKYALSVRSGEKRYVSINAVPLWSNEGEMTGIVCSILDLSEQQRLAAEHRHTATLLEARTHQERLVDAIAHHIRGSLDLTTILQTTTREVLHWLKADRVLIYRFTEKPGVGSVVVEACGSDYPSLLGWQLGNSTAGNCFIHPYCLEQNQAIEDISQAQLDPACVDLLQAFEVKSQLVIPIFQNQYGSPLSCTLTSNSTPASRSVWGLLIVHQCSHIRHWQKWQIELLQTLEFQLAVALQHAELYQQVQQLNTNLEFKVQQSTVKLRKALGCEAVVRRITDRVRDSLDEKVILPTALRELALA